MDHAARQIDALLDKYAESHRNPVNEAIHCICIPAIVFSLLGLLWAVHPYVAGAVVAGAMFYYLMLSPAFAIGMLLMTCAMLWLLAFLPQEQMVMISLAVFVLAWIGQFIGHKIEGRKPSFFDDLRFLLIGPLFVLGLLYRRLGMHF
ncbi:Uncharacterized membrane protein YGL010W [Noviherbaspirillum humi]|uniref:Uncharacterized membrane protein YGL010W n=1 Tax=Noviherbaspirillum humi TaxID=1688639 RepID=A0A239GH61_9BURK|nr:Mpo1-like protein [Noviherbaspirillum humi]SNS68078.1 Uncharacterized membrane protein YGL010W [Noviherbaspirillum humi]